MVLDHFNSYSSVIINQELQLKKRRMLAIKLMSVEQTNGQAMKNETQKMSMIILNVVNKTNHMPQF